MQFLLISAGCAECHSSEFGSLLDARVFNTFDEAKEASWIRDREWQKHPQGGYYAQTGQGDDWILEVPDGIKLGPVPTY